MPKINQSGFAQVLLMGIMVLGVFTAVYLSQQPQIFMPRAAETQPPRTLPVKIMPIGDSLTHGVKNGSSDPQNIMAGYRYYLYKNLTASGAQVDMVGSLSSGPADLADRDNEGHNGYDCLMISDLISNSATIYKPDVALLMCGVNDYAQIRTDQFKNEAINHLEKVIDNISTNSPNTKIILSTIVDSNLGYLPDLPAQIRNFNSKIPALAAKKLAEGKKIYLVDMFNGLKLSDLSDTVHPSEEGYQKMSDVWQNILKPLLAGTDSGIIANYSYVKPGDPQTVSWFNVNGNGASWIGLYKSDVPDSQFSSFVTWFYLGNCKNNQGTPTSSPKIGICTTQIPETLAQGQYEFRLYVNGTTLAQKSNKFSVTSVGFPYASPSSSAAPSMAPSAVPSISPSPSQTTQNIVSVTPTTASSGSVLKVNWQNLVGNNNQSWIGLYKSSESLTSRSYLDWMYLGNCSRINGTPTSSPVSGSCNFPVPSGIQPGTYEIRMFLQGTTFTSRSNTLQIN